MGILRSFDRRREQRTCRDLPLMVWGVDAHGERFLQEARARDMSLCGALLTGLDADLKSGDVIGILFGKKRACYRVVWVRYDGAGDKMQAAIHRLESDACLGSTCSRKLTRQKRGRTRTQSILNVNVCICLVLVRLSEAGGERSEAPAESKHPLSAAVPTVGMLRLRSMTYFAVVDVAG